MATNSVQDQLYPFSTEDNRAIPLDVIRPLSMIRASITNTALTSITIPADWKVASFFCVNGCYIEFADDTMPAVPASGVPYVNTLFVPPNCIITTTVLPGIASISAISGASTLIMQQVQKWAGMALRRQASSL